MMICIFSSNFFYIPSAHALSDNKQFVLDAWTLVNEGYYDPERLDELQWKRIRQKTLQKQIETSEEAYSAIEDMLKPLEDPFTRILITKSQRDLTDSRRISMR
jgi:carboxyl-terminal processing protease